MASYYINKSIKGNSIISNLNVENSATFNTHITNETGSTFDIGSSTNSFRNGYFNNIYMGNLPIGLYVRALFSGNNPISINSNGVISLNYDLSQFSISTNKLTISSSYIRSQFAGTSPITVSSGLIGLNIDTSQFSIANNKLSFDYTTPFAFNASGLELKYNVNQFNLSNDELTHKITNPFNYTTNGLELKLKKTVDVNGFELNKLFITDAGELDINLSNLIYPSSGLVRVPVLEEMLGLGLDLVGLGLPIPDLTILKVNLDTENLDFKSGKVSIKSLGQSRIPYYNAFKLTSESTFLYDDASNQLSVNRIVLNDTVDYSSANNRATTKQYVDNLNTYASNSALFYTQASGDSTREWNIRLNSKYLGLDADDKLITLITGAENKCISVSPENEILLTYETKHFGEDVNGKLISKFTTVANGCLGLTPDYELELNFNTTQFKITENKITSTLINKTGGCVLIDPDNELYLDFDTTKFKITAGKLDTTLATKLGDVVKLTVDNELYLDFNTDDFEISTGKLKHKITGSGAIAVSSTSVISVDVDTTYLTISTNKITFASTIITKINKIDTLETELDTTKTKLTTAEGKITTAEGKITATEGNVSSLTGRLTTAEGTISTHGGTLTTHTGQITALQGQIGGAIGAGVGGGVLGAGAGLAGGVLGGVGGATSSIGGATIAGLAGAGGALLGLGVGVIITEDPEPDAEGNPTYSYEITRGPLKVQGSITGEISIAPQPDAGTYNFNMPITPGTSGQVLTSGGGGSTAMTWTTPTIGTITSISASVPTFLSISGSPITSSGTLEISYSGTALPILNGGTGATTATGSGSVVLQSSPTLITPILGVATGTSLSLTGNVNSLTHTITGSTSGVITIQGQAVAGTYNFNLPTTAGTSGQVLTSQGTGAMTWITPITSVALSVPTFLSISGSPLTSNGTLAIGLSGTALPILNGGTGATTSTGSGSVVLANTPTLITPILGVASGTSLNLSGNINSLTHTITGSTSGVITIQGTTGTYNFNLPTTAGTAGQFLTSQGNSAMTWTSTTGSGSVVLQSSPTFTSPILGVATGTSLSLSATTASTSTTTGALVVSGGVGIAGDINVGGNLSIIKSSASITLRSALESESVFLYLSTPFNTSSPNKTAIISQGWNGYSRSKLHLCVNNDADSTTAVSVSDARLTVDTTGNVGIGITSPSTRLHIASDGTEGGAILALTESTHATSRRASILFGTGWQVGQDIYANGTKDFFIYGGTTQNTKFIISPLGNIGIGTLSPNAPLQFAATVANRKIVMFDTNNNDHQYHGFGVNAGMNRYQVPTGNSHAFFVGVNSTTSNELMRITGTGNVGIGTTSPNAPLQLGNTVVNRKILLYELANNDHQFYGFGINSGILRYQVDGTTSAHVFYAGTGTTTSNEIFRINGTGTAVITGSSPALTIATSSGTDGAVYLGNSSHGILRDGSNNVVVYTAGGSGGIALRANGFGGGNQLLVAPSGSVSIVNLAVTGTGGTTGLSRFFCNGGGIAATTETQSDYCASFNSWVLFNSGWRLYSDVRIKNNIQEIKSSSNFMKLEPKTYNYIDKRKDNGKQYGLIAQDVEKLYPDIVGHKEDYLPDVMSNVKVISKNSFEYKGELASKILVYIYPLDKTEVRKEVNVVSRIGNIFTIDIEIPSDKLFIYGNFTDKLLNINYTNFIPILIAELQTSNERITRLEKELLNLKK